MSHKVKSFKQQTKEVNELIESIPKEVKHIPDGIEKSIPVDLIEKTAGDLSEAIGGEKFSEYLSEFFECFRIFSTNTEMNTAGIVALNKNMKWFKLHIEKLEIEVKEIKRLLNASKTNERENL